MPYLHARGTSTCDRMQADRASPLRERAMSDIIRQNQCKRILGIFRVTRAGLKLTTLDLGRAS